MDLMCPVLELCKEPALEAEAAARLGVDLRRPGLDSFGIELLVPARVQRVGDVDPLAVAAHLDHLRGAVERSALGMGGLADDSAEVNAARLLRLEGVAHVVLQELASSPG